MKTLFLEDILSEAILNLQPAVARSSLPRNYTVKKEKNNIIFTSAAMGLLKSDIDMNIKEKHLFVKSNNKSKNSFSSLIDCKVYIGEDVIVEDSEAELESGILTIKLPIKESCKTQKISFWIHVFYSIA